MSSSKWSVLCVLTICCGKSARWRADGRLSLSSNAAAQNLLAQLPACDERFLTRCNPTDWLLCYAAGASAARRDVLQASAPAASLTPAQTELAELTATQAIAQLCSRNITAVEYVEALFARLDSGWSCINSFQTLNRSMVRSL